MLNDWPQRIRRDQWSVLEFGESQSSHSKESTLSCPWIYWRLSLHPILSGWVFSGLVLIGEGPKSFLLLETSHTYPTMMKRMWRRYISHTYPPQNIEIMWATSWVYWQLHFSPESSNKCYMGKKRQKTHFILNLSFLRVKSFQSLF